jgi:hypothetical protein
MTAARAAAAGATAALVWAAVEPLDRRIFRCDYSDVALLGKAVTRSAWWRPTGLAMHAANGAAFGLALRGLQRRTGWSTRRLALGAALVEHVALYPLNVAVDRFHPARGDAGLPPLATNKRAFAQATFRHALFGFVLGWLVEF